MSKNPQDNGNLEYIIKFNRTSEEYEIDQPDGFNKLVISIKQDYVARDIIFKDLKLNFINRKKTLGHQFDKLLNEYNTYGFETDVNLTVYANGVIWFDGELNFNKTKTDNKTYLQADLNINNYRDIINDREDVEVDLLGTSTFSGLTGNAAIVEEAKMRASLQTVDIYFNTRDYTGNFASTINPLVTDTVNSTTIYPVFGKLNTALSPFNDFLPFIGQNRYGYKGGDNIMFPSIDISIDAVNNSQYLPIAQDFYNRGFYQIKTDVGYAFTLSINNIVLGAELVWAYEDDISFNFSYKINGRNHFGLLITTFTDNTYSTINYCEWKFIGSIYNIDPTSVSFTITTSKTTKTISYTEAISLPENSIVTLVYCTRAELVIGSEYFSNMRAYIQGGVNASFLQSEIANDIPDTVTELIQIKNAGDKLIEYITDGNCTLSSDYLTNRYADSYLTNGFRIREFTNKAITLNWKKYKESLMAMFNMDVEVNGNNVFLGNYREFFADVMIAEYTIGKDTQIDIEGDDDFQINLFQLKYSNFENDDEDNTNDSFLTESQWKLANKKVGKTDKREIGFTADGRSIETIRRDGVRVSPTKTMSEDDNIYIIDTYNDPEDGLMNRFNEGFSNVFGILRTLTENNLRYSFKRLIYDNYLEYLNEIAIYNSGDLLTNTFFKNNGSLNTEADNTLDTWQLSMIDKNPLERIGNPITKPIKYKFSLPIRLSWQDAINLFNAIHTQRGYVRFHFPNETIDLYPCDGTEYYLNEKRLEFVGKPKI